MTIKALLKKTKITYWLARGLRRVPDPFLSLWLRVCHRLWGVDGSKVYFSSFGGMLYNDNPRAVCEQLHRICPEARIVFRLSGRGMAQDMPEYVVPAPRRSLRALREMATARVIVKNAGMLPWMRKFPDQFYIQTWHGDRGFKKIRLDKSAATRTLIRESEWLDLMVSGSEFGSRVYRSAFNFRGEILECGCPRNDILVENDPKTAAAVRAELGVDATARVLLYAPTFRNRSTGSKIHAPLSVEKVRTHLETVTGEHWISLARGHELNLGVVSDAQMDVSDYPEAGMLLLITDLLITDYSSIGGDFMLLGRPTVFYQPDLDQYLAERGLYFNPDDSPLLVAHTEAELLDLLSHPIDGAQNCREALDFFGARETGRAAEAVARRIAALLRS